MKIFDSVLEKIDKGKSGETTGLYHGFPRLREFIPDIYQGTYFLVGAQTSEGKTALCDDFFMYKPFEHLQSTESNIKLQIKYFSLEIDKTRKITKGIARKLFLDYGELHDVNYILSKGKNRISNDVYNKVLTTRKYFDKLEESLEVVDKAITPVGVYHFLKKYADDNGKWIEKDFEVSYIPNDPNVYTIVIIDHIGLISKEKGLSKKESIDKLSNYMIFFRNKCGFIPVLISQFNRSISSTDRFKIEMVQPQLSDFKESGNPSEDCDICFALFNPYKYGIDNYNGYNIKELKHNFRGLSILKNRDGDADRILGLKFIGKVGAYSEYPKAEDMIYGSQNGTQLTIS